MDWIVGIMITHGGKLPIGSLSWQGEKSSYPLSMVNTAGYSDEWVFI